MTHSNGVEVRDVGGEYDAAVPKGRRTRRFTLHLSDHTSRDSFDEFSYIELLTSELHESLSSVATSRWHEDFYVNSPAGTLDIHSQENNQSDSEDNSTRKKQKLVTRCLSHDSQDIFHSAETANLFPGMISKQNDVQLGGVTSSNLSGDISNCLVGSRLSCFIAAENVLPTQINLNSAETVQHTSSCPTENHLDGHTSTIPDGIPHRICPPDFPDNLPLQLFDVINQIKQAIGSPEYVGQKCGGRLRFTKDINQLLVQVETLSQSLTSLSRDMVFSHLSSLLSCEPELLSKRAKKLRLAQNGDALKDPIGRLKEEIQNIMPSLIERHNEEILAAERLLLQQLESKECSASRVTSDGRVDEEGEEVQEVSEEKMKRVTFPRKKFRWNQAIRMRLCDVVRLKMQQFIASKIQSQTAAEEYLKAFLDAEIKPLWPRGWIQTRMLFKESRTSHQQWTMKLPKLKRMCVFSDKLSKNLMSITGQQTIASGSSTPMTSPSTPMTSPSTPMTSPLTPMTSASTVPVCALQTKTLMDFAAETSSCKKVKLLKDEEDNKTGFGCFSRSNQTTTTNNENKWSAQLEEFSKAVGSGGMVSIPPPMPIYSPTLATKYWLLRAALESKTGLYGALNTMDAKGSVPASLAAVASASSSTVCSAAAAAAATSSVKMEADAQTTQSAEFLARSFKFSNALLGGNGVAEGSGVLHRSGIAESTDHAANGFGSVHTRLQELLQHRKVAVTSSASMFHPSYLPSNPVNSKSGPDPRADTAHNSSGKQSLPCSGFPSIFVFPPGTPLVGVMFCRAPMPSPQPSPAANTNKLHSKNPDGLSDTTTFVRRSCLPCGSGGSTTESLCHHPSSSSQAPGVPTVGCPRNDVDQKQDAKDTAANALPPPPPPLPPPPPESPLLTATPFVAFPNSLSVFRQFLAPVTTP